ncbi:unnamed protein product [Durusdinium trenchii]|uniref:DUF4200 domain-containing protein n=3 Tax=Durusdinium trenchii TaxID=1381693 RepID=A0ABP0NTE0_9DINO
MDEESLGSSLDRCTFVEAMEMVEGEHANPFSLPEELECFWLQPPPPERTEHERLQEKKLRVHEKSTCSSSYGAIRKVHDHELPMAPVSKSVSLALANAKAKVLEEERPPPTFLTTVATKPAVGLVEPLHKSEKDIRTYIQKKREVFLVHMACDNKREEAVRLDAMAKAKEDALAFSQQTLEEDAKKFEDYLQERISKASHATKESEKHAKNKQDKVQKIKNLKQQIATVQSETGKLKEARVESERLKHFLEKLTPAEWKEEQKVKKEERKRERAQRWKNERLAPILEQLAIEDEKLSEKFAQEEAEAAELLRKKSKKSRRREDEEELLQKQRERDLRKKRIQKKREEEERKVNGEYVEVSSEEEPELFFKEPQQLMDTFTELEELNLFLIQSSQGTEQELDEMRHNFEAMKMDMGQKVQQLKDQIKQLEQNIKQEKRHSEELRRSHVEKASTAAQDKKLSDLAMKVHDVYKRCDLARDQQQLDTLQMLGAIETRIEELIQGLDEAYQQDEELVMRLEWQKERDRRERVRENRIREQSEKQEDRLKQSLLRSQKPVFKKAGKQVMYRSPPLRQERKIVEDTTDDEAHARDHKVFDLYIDRKTGMPHTDAPTEEARRSTDTALSAPPPSSPKSQSMSEALESREVFM